jgi:hypothetical protein
MLVKGLAFETFTALLPEGFNFVRPKIDRMRRRSKCSDELLSFATKSELLVARRLADRISLDAPYLVMFTLKMWSSFRAAA